MRTPEQVESDEDFLVDAAYLLRVHQTQSKREKARVEALLAWVDLSRSGWADPEADPVGGFFAAAAACGCRTTWRWAPTTPDSSLREFVKPGERMGVNDMKHLLEMMLRD